MPVTFGINVVEGKVYRSKKRTDEEEERQILRELQTVLNSKGRKTCDCEAQIHDLLENCLNCGRLTCEFEGSGRCVSCGNLVLNPEQRERFRKHIDGVQQDERSQEKSLQNGPRTKIIDNKIDHFAIDSKRHLKEEVKRKLRDNLDELQSKRYQRKLVLDIDIDNLEAGLRSVPQIDDYESALRNLNINQASSEIGKSEYLLSSLVQIESKKTYQFQYIGNRDINMNASNRIGTSNKYDSNRKSQYKKSNEFVKNSDDQSKKRSPRSVIKRNKPKPKSDR